MAFSGTGKIWMNGKFVDWKDATIHIGSHVIHYGSGVFEGARCYETPKGSACFRLDAHMRRLQHSSRSIEWVSPGFGRLVQCRARYDSREPDEGLLHPAARLSRLRNSGSTRWPAPSMPSSWSGNGERIWGPGSRAGRRREGEHLVRMAPNTLPALAKSSANYANSALIKMEAVLDSYTEGIALDVYGNVSEGSGQNIFMVRDGHIMTPPLASSVLGGITRDSIITLAQELGYTVTESVFPREMLYMADELFFVGTAAEVTPIRSVDKLQIGSGRPGPVTKALQRSFFDVINGTVPDTHGWLTYVYPEDSALRQPLKTAAVRGR